VRREQKLREEVLSGFVSFKIASTSSYQFAVALWRTKRGRMQARVKYWELIADNLKKGGCSLGYVSALNREGRTIWVADAHRGDGYKERSAHCGDAVVVRDIPKESGAGNGVYPRLLAESARRAGVKKIIAVRIYGGGCPTFPMR